MTVHILLYEAHFIAKRRPTGTATVTCTCNLNTGPIPSQQAHRVTEGHADAVGLPDPLRRLRHFLLGVR